MEISRILHVGIWKIAACAIGVCLAVNAVKSAMGLEDFAWWHIITIALCLTMSYSGKGQQARKKTADPSLSKQRAVRRLAALLYEEYDRFFEENNYL